MAAAVEPIEELPDIDDRLALPEAGYEIIDGVVTFVVPSDPPHGTLHADVAALIVAHVDRAVFEVAVDMLTRTSKIDDIAPDVSVFSRAAHPVTGGRQLEQLAFEIVSTESMSHATTKAAKLAGRGVRRVFAIDLRRHRVVEWSRELSSWVALDLGSRIDDPVLAASLSVGALLDTADAEAEVARALIARRHPAIEAVRMETRAESVLAILDARRLELSLQHRARIAAERDPERLAAWTRRAVGCTALDELFDGT